MLNLLADWLQGRGAARELSRLSDRRLEDLGVARAEIREAIVRASASAADARSAPMARPATSRAGGDAMAPSWALHNRRALAD